MTPLYQVAISILGEATQGGFACICKSIHKNFKIPADKLPSYYMLVKERPKMIYFEIDALNNSPADVENVENNNININSTTNDNIIIPKEIYSASTFIGESVDIDEALKLLKVNKTILASKIEGGYEKYIYIMLKQHQRLFCDSNSYNRYQQNIIVLDSYNGAEHCHTLHRRKIIVSLSS